MEPGLRGGRSRTNGRDLRAGGEIQVACDGRRDRDGPNTEERVLRFPVRQDLRGDRLHRVRRDREADALVAARVALDLRVDADHAAVHVEERAAGVPVVDGGVGLDGIGDREVVRSVDLTVESADDPARDGLLEPERRADRHDAVTDRDLRRVAERERHEHRARRVHVHDREVGRGVGPDDGPLVGRAVPELHRDRRGAVDDVLVRDHVAARVVDEAGALGALSLRLSERRVLRRRDGELDDAFVRAAVDLADAERVGARRRCRVVDRHLPDDGLRARAPRGVGQDAAAHADHERGGEGGDGSSARETHRVHWNSPP